MQHLPPVGAVLQGVAEVRRLEQIMGEVSKYAPPDLVHEWQEEIYQLIEQARRTAVQGVYDHLTSMGIWQQPH